MRLALLGPAEGHPDLLERAVKQLIHRDPVDRAVYLGVDGALDPIIRSEATRLVGDNPSEEGLWVRAARACSRSTPEAIDEYIAAERAREALRIFESLPDADTRAVEMLAGALLVMIHDKAKLDEEDMIPARLLVFGKSKSPVVKQVGQRWFVSPGTAMEGGLAILEDSDDGIDLTLFDGKGDPLRTERLSTLRSTKMTVGAAGA